MSEERHEEVMLRAIIEADQKICDLAIKKVRFWRRTKFWLIASHIALYECYWATYFYELRYWMAIGSVLECMALVSIWWWNCERLINTHRMVKRMFARHKLEAQTVLAQIREKRERGFE